jgi:DNA-binding LacI/PurR family transcriptional regulator
VNVPVSIREVAALAGVSVATVSNVIIRTGASSPSTGCQAPA